MKETNRPTPTENRTLKTSKLRNDATRRAVKIWSKLGRAGAGLSVAVLNLAALLTQFSGPSGFAATYYWDNNGSTVGFGTAAGTWASLTTGNATQGWSTSSAGTVVPGNVTTLSGDVVNFGTTTVPLAAGTVNVSGSVTNTTLNILNYATGSGAITLSGGNITLGGASPSLVVQSTGNTINTPIILSPSSGFGSVSFSRTTSAVGTLTLNGGISGSGDLTFTTPNVNSGNWPQSVVLGAACSYSGNTAFTTGNSGTTTLIQCGAVNALPTNTVLTISGGAGSGSGRGCFYDLNGYNQTLAGLANTAASLRNQYVFNSSSANAVTLTLNENSTHTFSSVLGWTGNIPGPSTPTYPTISLVMNGTGTAVLSGVNQYTGSTSINLGTLQIGGAGTLGGGNYAANVSIASGAALLFSSTANTTLSGLISGGGSLTNAGTGTLTISGTDALANTTVSGGTLAISGGSVNALNVNPGGTLSLPAAGTSTVTNLTFASTGTMSFNVAAGGVLTVAPSGGVTNNGAAGSITINITGSAPANGLYTLMTYGGSLQGSGFSAYQLGSTPVGQAYSLSNSAGAVQLVVSTPLYWTGANGPEWSTNPLTPQNWTFGLGGSPSDYTNGLGVVFDDTATSYTVDVSSNDVTPLSVGFNNNATYTLQGSKAIAGAASLSMSGAGTVTVLNANTYTSPTIISAGTVQLGDGTSGHDGTIANSPSVVNSGALVYNRFGSAAYGGVISGSGTVTMNGTGTQTLSGANTYTGTTTVSGGELDISNWGANTPGTINVGNVMGTTGTLGIFGGTLGSSGSGIGNFYVGNSSTGIVNQTTGTVYVNIGGGALLLGNDTALTGIGGTGTYNLSGGSVAATGASTARGVMIGVNNGSSGTFNLSGTGNLALGLAELAVGRNDSAVTNCTVAFNQTGGTAAVGYLSVGGQSGATTTTATFSLTGGTLVATNFQNLVAAASSSATLTLGGSAQVTLPALPVPAGTVKLTLDFTTGWLAPLAASQAYMSGLTAAYLTANGANFNVAGGNDITVAQSFQNAPSQAGALNKTGTGTLTLSGVNTYSGNTTVSAGELKFSTAGSAATSVTVAGGATNGVLVASSNGQWVNTASLTNNNGSVVDINCGAAAPSTTVAPIKVNNLSLGTGLTIRISGGGFVGGQSYPLITWTGSGPADASGFSTLILPNRVSGNLGVSGSTLYFSVTSTTAPLTWNTGDGTWNTGTPNWLDATLATASYADGDWVLLDDASGATGNPTITLTNTLSPVKVTMRSSSHDYTLSGSGAIAGNGSLTLDAANTRILTLSGANTYAGGTTISGGTLVANSANALGTGPVINNGTLNLVAGGVTYSGLQTSLAGSGTNNVTLATGSANTILYGDYSQFTGVWNVGIGNVGGKIAINFPKDNAAVVYNVLTNATVFCASPATNYSGTAYLYGGSPGENYGQLRLQNCQWSGPIILAAPSSTAAGKGTIGVLSPTVGNYSGPISEMNGSQPLVIAGNGTCILGGANTFTGPTLFTTASTLMLSNQLALQYSTLNFTTTYADVLQFAPGINRFTLGGLTGNRDIALDDLAFLPVALTLGGNGQSTAHSGALSGAGSLTKVGAGTLTLYGNSTYSGRTTISNGALVGVTGGACGSSSVTVANTTATLGVSITNSTLSWSCANLTLAAAGTLDFNFGSVPPSVTQAPLVVYSAVDFTAKPSVIVRGASLATLAIGSYPLMTWGAVSGTVPTSVLLPPTMAGNLSVSGNTLYLNITSASALPIFWATGSGTWDINTSANWKDKNGVTTTYQESAAGSALVVFDDVVSGPGPAITVTLSTSVVPASVTFSNSAKNFTVSGTGAITGTIGVTQYGSGTNTMATTNTYTGATTVNAGELDLVSWGASTLGQLTVSGASGATLGLSGSATYNLGGNNFFVGSGAGGNGIVNQTGGTVSFTSGNGLLLGNGGGAGTYNLSGGTISSYASASRGIMLGVNNASSGTFNLKGTGNISMAGELAVGRNDSVAINGTAAFYQTGGTATVGYLSVGGYSAATNTTATFSLSGGTFAATNFQNLVAAASSSATMTLGGSAQVTLPAFPTRVGTANLTFDYTTGWLAPQAASVAYLSGLTAAYLTTNGANFNVASGKDITVAQVFQNAPSQAGVLRKTGDGVLTLSGTNTYTGSTAVNAGALLVNNTTGSGTGTGAVIVNTNGTLGGTGTVNGTVSVNAGGTLSPGTSVGTLTTGSQTWNGGAAYRFELSSATNSASRDLLIVNGTLNVQATAGAKLTVNLASMANTTTPGLVPDFKNSGSYSWVIASASGGILNFDASKFALDVSTFSNAFTGTFSVAVQGNSLVVNYTLPPTIAGSGPLTGTSFPLTFSGPNGQSYSVLTSTNVALPLASWTALSSGTFGASPVTYTDTSATNAHQFYRIQSP